MRNQFYRTFIIFFVAGFSTHAMAYSFVNYKKFDRPYKGQGKYADKERCTKTDSPDSDTIYYDCEKDSYREYCQGDSSNCSDRSISHLQKNSFQDREFSDGVKVREINHKEFYKEHQDRYNSERPLYEISVGPGSIDAHNTCRHVCMGESCRAQTVGSVVTRLNTNNSDGKLRSYDTRKLTRCLRENESLDETPVHFGTDKKAFADFLRSKDQSHINYEVPRNSDSCDFAPEKNVTKELSEICSNYGGEELESKVAAMSSEKTETSTTADSQQGDKAGDHKETSSSSIENLNYRQLYFEMIATASALGVAPSGKLCEKLGNRSKSYDLIVNSLSKYHQDEIDHINKMKNDFNELEKEGERLLENKSDNLQLEAIAIQKASKQIELDALIGENGKVPRRKEFLSKLKDVEIAGLREYDFFQNELRTCRQNIDRSISVAKKGCERYVIVEECDGEGNCTSHKEADPVEGSCEAETNLPHLNNIVESYHDHYLQILPSKLQEEGFDNLVEKYTRYYNGAMIPEGDWKPNAGNCLNLLTDLYKKTGVVCQSLSEDGKDRSKWDLPPKGDKITDMYEAFLGRYPDEGGLQWHTEEYEMFLEEGHSEDEALNMVRNTFISSAEYRGVERGEQEIKNAEQFLAANDLSGEICTTLSCQDKNSGPDQITQDMIAKTLRDVEEIAKPGMFTMTDEEEEYLKKSTLEKIRQSDLVIGESYNRISIIEGIYEIATRLNEKDLEKAEVVLSQVEALEKLHQEVKALQDSNQISGVSSNQEEKNLQQDNQKLTASSLSSSDQALTGQAARATARGDSPGRMDESAMGNNDENSKKLNQQVSSISKSGGPLSSETPSLKSTQSSLDKIADLKADLNKNNAISSSNMTRGLKRTRRDARDRATKLNEKFDREAKLDKINKAFSRPGSESQRLFASKISSMPNSGAKTGQAKGKSTFPTSSGVFQQPDRKASGPSSTHQATKKTVTRRYKSRSSRSPSSVKTTRRSRSRRNSAGPDGASREKQVAKIYKDLKDSGLYRPEAGITSGEVNPRNQDLFKIISRRYMVSGLKRLQDLED